MPLLDRPGRALLLALLLGGAPGLAAQEPPPKPTPDPAREKRAKELEEREKKAKDLLEAADQLEKDGKLAEAQKKLRELRSRYRSTRVYWDQTVEIQNRIVDIGTKLTVAALSRQTLYKKPHMDAWHGYEFAPPDGWTGIPPAQNWFGDNDASEVNYKGQLIRITRYTSPSLERLYLQVHKLYAAASAAELEDKVMSDLTMRFKGLKEEGKAVPIPGRSGTARKVYATPDGDRVAVYPFFAEKKGLALVGTWRSGDDEGGFSIIISTSTSKTVKQTKRASASAADFESALKVFDQAARSFWIYDAGTKAGKMVALDRGARCSDWNVMNSPKGLYVVEYATKPEFAKRVGEELEQIQALYRQVIPTGKAIPRCRVKVFDSEEDFMYYGQAPGAAAYWSPSQEEIVCYRFQGDKMKLRESGEEMTIAAGQPPEEATFKVLYHEAFHQYMYFLMGRDRFVDIPSWLNEGLGDYFFGGQWGKNRKFAIGLNDWRLGKIWRAVKKEEHVPLDKLVKYKQMEYYSNPGLCYAQGWAMNYFFQSEAGKKKGYAGIPQALIRELQNSANMEKSTAKVFSGIDLKKMEAEWKAFVLALPVPKEEQEEPDPLKAFK